MIAPKLGTATAPAHITSDSAAPLSATNTNVVVSSPKAASPTAARSPSSASASTSAAASEPVLSNTSISISTSTNLARATSNGIEHVTQSFYAPTATATATSLYEPQQQPTNSTNPFAGNGSASDVYRDTAGPPPPTFGVVPQPWGGSSTSTALTSTSVSGNNTTISTIGVARYGWSRSASPNVTDRTTNPSTSQISTILPPPPITSTQAATATAALRDSSPVGTPRSKASQAKDLPEDSRSGTTGGTAINAPSVGAGAQDIQSAKPDQEPPFNRSSSSGFLSSLQAFMTPSPTKPTPKPELAKEQRLPSSSHQEWPLPPPPPGDHLAISTTTATTTTPETTSAAAAVGDVGAGVPLPATVRSELSSPGRSSPWTSTTAENLHLRDRTASRNDDGESDDVRFHHYPVNQLFEPIGNGNGNGNSSRLQNSTSPGQEGGGFLGSIGAALITSPSEREWPHAPPQPQPWGQSRYQGGLGEMGNLSTSSSFQNLEREAVLGSTTGTGTGTASSTSALFAVPPPEGLSSSIDGNRDTAFATTLPAVVATTATNPADEEDTSFDHAIRLGDPSRPSSDRSSSPAPSISEAKSVVSVSTAARSTAPSQRPQDFKELQQHIGELTEEKFTLQRCLEQQSELADRLAAENEALAVQVNTSARAAEAALVELEVRRQEVAAARAAAATAMAERDAYEMSSHEAAERANSLAVEVVVLEEKVLRIRSEKMKMESKREHGMERRKKEAAAAALGGPQQGDSAAAAVESAASDGAAGGDRPRGSVEDAERMSRALKGQLEAMNEELDRVLQEKEVLESRLSRALREISGLGEALRMAEEQRDAAAAAAMEATAAVVEAEARAAAARSVALEVAAASASATAVTPSPLQVATSTDVAPQEQNLDLTNQQEESGEVSFTPGFSVPSPTEAFFQPEKKEDSKADLWRPPPSALIAADAMADTAILGSTTGDSAIMRVDQDEGAEPVTPVSSRAVPAVAPDAVPAELRALLPPNVWTPGADGLDPGVQDLIERIYEVVGLLEEEKIEAAEVAAAQFVELEALRDRNAVLEAKLAALQGGQEGDSNNAAQIENN